MAYKAPDYPPPTYAQQAQPQYESGPATDPRATQGYYGSPPPNQYNASPYPQDPYQQGPYQQGPYQQGSYGPPGPYGYQQQPMYYQQQPPMGYYDRGYGGGQGRGACEGIFAALACCCCLDLLLI